MSNKQPPSISRRLRTFINAMRDAEILAVGNIPKSYVLGRRTIKEIPNSVSITDTK